MDRLDQLNKAEHERDDLKVSLAAAQANLKQLTSNSHILELWQAGFWGYRQFDLRREVGEYFDMGACPGERCYRFTIMKIEGEGGKGGRGSKFPVISFSLTGRAVDDCLCKVIELPLVEGSKVGIATSDIDFNILVESDRLSNLRLGVSVRDGSADPEKGAKIMLGGFVSKGPVNLDEYYSRWGATADSLPFNVFDNDRTRIQEAKVNALNSQKILMVQFGANWCPDCLLLDKMLKEEPLASFVSTHFVILNIDTGYFNKNMSLADQHGLNLRQDGIPAIVFIFADGTEISGGGEDIIANARKYEKADVMKYLKNIIDQKKVKRM